MKKAFGRKPSTIKCVPPGNYTELFGKYKSDLLTIVTFLWNDPKAKHKGTYEFTSKHVNKLAYALKEYVTIPHRFMCITDTPKGIDTEIVTVFPMWMAYRDLGRCFTRLRLWADDIKEIIGPRIAMIDLDVIPLGNLDHVFGRKEPFIGYRDSKNPECYSGAFYLMDAGSKSQVFNTFNRLYNMIDPKVRPEVFKQMYNRLSPLVGSDQSWISECLGRGLPRFGQEDGIYDFWTIEELPKLPENTRMVMMNGMRRDASMKEFQEKYPWIENYWKS